MCPKGMKKCKSLFSLFKKKSILNSQEESLQSAVTIESFSAQHEHLRNFS